MAFHIEVGLLAPFLLCLVLCLKTQNPALPDKLFDEFTMPPHKDCGWR